MLGGVRTFVIAGTIRFENNTAIDVNKGETRYTVHLWNHESNNYFEDFIPMEKARKDRIKVIKDKFYKNFLDALSSVLEHFSTDNEENNN